MDSPHVIILDHTAHPLKAVYLAARTCYSAESPHILWKKEYSRVNMENLVRKTVEAGHHSVLEHAVFVFAISGISRACSHQLVRHRLASFSQQSQRYVKSEKPLYITPPGIRKKPALLAKYEKAVNGMYGLYVELLKAGIPGEDARFVLPNAASTNFIMSMNLRELIHVCSIRLCSNAQWEIRGLFEKVRRTVSAMDPFLGSLLLAKCDVSGYCSEMRSCGRHTLKKDVMPREK